MNISQAQKRLESLLDNPQDKFKLLLEPSREVVIYGAGNCGRRLLTILRNKGYQIPVLLDSRAYSLGPVDGVACVTPDSQQAQAFASAGIPVIIAVFNPLTDVHEIKNSYNN